VLSVLLDKALTEAEVAYLCSAMATVVAAEAGIGAEDLTCEMTAYDLATFDYGVVFTLAIPEADGDVSVEVASALVASIDLLPGLEGASVALTSVTDGEKETEYIRISSSAKATPSFYAALCALVMIVR